MGQWPVNAALFEMERVLRLLKPERATADARIVVLYSIHPTLYPSASLSFHFSMGECSVACECSRARRNGQLVRAVFVLSIVTTRTICPPGIHLCLFAVCRDICPRSIYGILWEWKPSIKLPNTYEYLQFFIPISLHIASLPVARLMIYLRSVQFIALYLQTFSTEVVHTHLTWPCEFERVITLIHYFIIIVII